MSERIIKLYRGDTYKLPIDLKLNGREGSSYKLVENDALYFFVVEPHAELDHALIAIKLQCATEQKPKGRVLPANCGIVDLDGNITVILPSEATENLLPGVYYYTVKLLMDHQNEDNANLNVNDTITFIGRTKFIVLE